MNLKTVHCIYQVKVELREPSISGIYSSQGDLVLKATPKGVDLLENRSTNALFHMIPWKNETGVKAWKQMNCELESRTGVQELYPSTACTCSHQVPHMFPFEDVKLSSALNMSLRNLWPWTVAIPATMSLSEYVISIHTTYIFP